MRTAAKSDAFISYSHDADDFRAGVLQRMLQNVARPFYKRRSLNIFRDQTSLASNPALWPAIERALGQARFFILLASPDSAASPWCSKEIEWWLTNRSAETLLIVLTAGELVFDESRRDFDWTRTTALSPALAGTFAVEPFYCDLRWLKRDGDLSLANARVRAEVLPLAAALHGMEPQELDSEDLRQFRRTRRFWRGAAAALALLAVTSAAAAWMAMRASREATEQRNHAVRASGEATAQRNHAVRASREATAQRDNAVRAQEAERTARLAETKERQRAEAAQIAETEQRQRAEAAQRQAVEQRDEAIRQRNLAVARQLAIKAEFLQNDKAGLLTQSALLAAESLRRAPSLEADRTLRRGLALLSPQIAEAHYPEYMPYLGMSASRDHRLAFMSVIPPGNQEIRIVDFSPDSIADVGSWRADRMITGLALAGDGMRLSMTAEDGTIYVWEPPAAPRIVLQCDGEVIASAAGKTRLAVGCGSSLRLVDLPQGTVTEAGQTTSDVIGLGFNDDETHLAAACSDGSLIVWAMDGVKELFRTKPGYAGQIPLEGGGGADYRSETHVASMVAFSPDGTLVTKASVDKILQLWDVATGKEVARLAHDGMVLAIQFGDSGRLIATGSADGKARVFDTATGGLVSEMRHQGAVRSVRFAERDRSVLIATASEDATARLWDVDSGRELSRATPGSPAGWAVPWYWNRFAVLTYDGTLRLFAGAADRELFIEEAYFAPIATDWSLVDDAFVMADKRGHSKRLDFVRKRRGGFGETFEATKAIWSADGGILMLSGSSRTQVWDVLKERKLADHAIEAHAMSADGSMLAAVTTDHTIVVIHVGEKDPRVRVAVRSFRTPDLAVSRRQLAFVAGSDLVLRSLADATQTTIATGYGGKIAFSPDERYLAWAAATRPRVFDLAARREIALELERDPESTNRLLFAADGSRVVLASSTWFGLWSLPDGRRLASARLEADIGGLAFSRDGRRLVIGSHDGTARIWSVTDGVEIARVEAALGSKGPLPILAVALNPNGDYLLTTTPGSHRLWSLSPQGLLAAACQNISHRLTRDEWRDYAGNEPYPDTCSK